MTNEPTKTASERGCETTSVSARLVCDGVDHPEAEHNEACRMAATGIEYRDREWRVIVRRLEAALAALRSRVNEAERERDRLSDARQELGVERDMLKMENEQVRRDLETRDAEVERLRTLIARAAWYDDKTKRDCGSCSRSVENCNTRVWESGWNCLGFYCRAALATPEATTPAVPEPKETL